MDLEAANPDVILWGRQIMVIDLPAMEVDTSIRPLDALLTLSSANPVKFVKNNSMINVTSLSVQLEQFKELVWNDN